MNLTEGEKARIRRALGYVGTTESTALAFGMVASVEYLFLVNKRMDSDFDPEFMAIIREDLGRCEATVDQMFCAQQNLAALQVGNIRTNPEEIDKLKQAWRFWAARLADSLGLPSYPNSFAKSGNGMNARVCHG